MSDLIIHWKNCSLR